MPFNIIDILAYILPIFTSIYWLVTNEKNDQTIQLLSFSCLFLDLKFLLFFRSFESFGVYFAIIISVAKQIFYFLIVLFIILTSFAHAFYILLTPRSEYSFQEAKINEDSNNPWSMSPTYKILEGINEFKQIIVQQPDENTNMFIDYKTALFAVYLSLAGIFKFFNVLFSLFLFFFNLMHLLQVTQVHYPTGRIKITHLLWY